MMATLRYTDEVLVTISSTEPANNLEYPTRKVILSKQKPSVAIGRTSKRDEAFFAKGDNCWFDSPVMSREHAKLQLDADTQAVTISDTGSLHGTFVNNHPLLRDTPHMLKNDDKVTLGVTIDKGTTKFAPCVFKVDMKAGSISRPASKPVVFSVPDDSDIEEVDDHDIQIQNAIDILEKNRLRLGPKVTLPLESVDLTNDEPVNSGSRIPMIDLSIPRLPTTAQDGDNNQIMSYETPSSTAKNTKVYQIDGATSDINSDNASNVSSHSESLGLQTLLQLNDEDEDEDVIDDEYEDREISESEEDDYEFNDLDDSLDEGSNESVCGSGEEHSEDENTDLYKNMDLYAKIFLSSDPSISSSTGGAVADSDLVALKRDAPGEDSVQLEENASPPEAQVSKPVATSSDLRLTEKEKLMKKFVDYGREHFFKAREINKQRINMKPGIVVDSKPGNIIQTPPEEHTNTFEGIFTPNTTVTPSKVMGSSHSVGSQLTPQSLKRKADDISEQAQEEVQEAPNAKQQDKNQEGHTAAPPQPRPAKRLRRIVEAAGYAALGGVAVMGALIATAPDL